jgi:hypothetical protein
MKLLIKGESDFFLFQDIVYYFLLILKRKWMLPIKNKHNYDTCSHYIYESWNDVLNLNIIKHNNTKLADKLIGKCDEWMITTNIAILEAQKENGRRKLASFENDYLEKFKPYFLIEHSNKYSNYIVYLNGDMELMFLSAVSFYKAFLSMDYKMIIDELKKYFEIEEFMISKELRIVIDNYVCNEFSNRKLQSYEIMED